MPSDKITSKNLSYTRTLPPFLAALQGGYSQSRDGDGPDPLLAGRRRVAKPRSGSAEAEDAPVVVDEEGNVVAGLKVGADGTVREEEEEDGRDNSKNGEDGGLRANGEDKRENEAELEKEKSAAIGGSKKRKLGRVVGGQDAEEGDDRSAHRHDKSSKVKGKDNKEGGVAKCSNASGLGEEKPTAKAKKKAKKIKLSFGDDAD